MRPVSLGALSALEGSDLAEEVPPAVLTLLAQRGFDCPEKARAFLHPKLRDLTCPFEMPDMRAAVERIFAAADEGEEVVLYGDYDVDGVTSLTLLTQALRAYGLDPKPFLPHRIDEGYGVTREGLERCLLEFDPDLLIAVDCGTGSLDEIADLRARGIDVIVLDHHEPSPNGRPDVIALVNPKAADSDYQYLCSAGVAFKLAHALVKARPNDGLDLKKFLDIAAVGTVADIVPLVEENRILVRHGFAPPAGDRKPGRSAR
ncbi:MAG: DHH family phosphoesterase [Verrucomicrobiales bacterium]